MDTSEWISFVVTSTVAVVTAWPVAVVIVAFMFRRQLSAAGRWVAEQAERRPFEAAGGPQGLSLRLGQAEGGTPNAYIAADAAAAGSLSEAGAEGEALQAKLAAARTALAEADSAWNSDALQTSEARARRIAERAKIRLAEDAEGSDVVGYTFDLSSEDDPQPRPLGRFLGSREARALLSVRFFIDYARGVEDADWVDWVRAAEILRDEGLQIPVPPFRPSDLRMAAEARSMGWVYKSA